MKQTELKSEKPLYFVKYNSTVKKELFERKFKLIKVISGKATISNSNESIIIRQNQYAFVGSGCFSKIEMTPANDKPFMLICMNFDEHTFSEYAKHNTISEHREISHKNLYILNKTAWLDSLFCSLSEYINSKELPDGFLLKIKQMESLHILNKMSPDIIGVMLCKNKPHKIDLVNFMEENYMYNAPLERFAELSGRSLSSFRREFTALFNTPPNKWIIDKRLSVAYEILSNGNKRPSEIYWEVGFETLAHFSRKFKEKYGVPPTSIIRRKQGQ